MKIICESQYCTACYACLNTCQHGAIEFYADNMGYLYPHVNEDLCVDCGMCMKTCPINHPVELHHPQKVLAIRNAANKPILSDDVAHTLINIAGISSSYYYSDRDFLSPKYFIKHRIVQDHIDYDERTKTTR